MALSPLQIELIDDQGVPVEAAVIELRHELTAASADGYERDGTVMAQPFLTDANGSKLVWLVNGIYEWRSTGAWTTDWKAFRAWGGFGVEGLFSSDPDPDVTLGDPPASATTLDTIAVPSFGVEDAVGGVVVTVDFDFDHVSHMTLSIAPPSGNQVTLFDGASDFGSDQAFDGTISFGPNGPFLVDAGLVDGGEYQIPNAATLRGEGAAGGWELQWSDSGLSTGSHSGTLRSWSLELVPV